jgi:hypothetical protein
VDTDDCSLGGAVDLLGLSMFSWGSKKESLIIIRKLGLSAVNVNIRYCLY